MSALRLLLPVVLGILAAILNFMVLRGSTAPLELAVLNTDLKADTELTDDMLDRLPVRADKGIVKSVVPYSDRGLLLGRRVMRPIGAGEVLLYTDVHNLDEENISLYLKPGETTLTIPVKSSRVAPGLRRGDSIGILVTMRPEPNPSKSVLRTPADATRMLGPFRLLRLGTVVDPYRSAGLGEASLLQVAIKPGANGQLDPMVGTLQKVLAASASGGSNSGVLAVEYYKSAK